MCFYLEHYYDTTPKIAQEDIVVYKVGHKKFLGLLFTPIYYDKFHYFKWIKTKKVKLVVNPNSSIQAGYHSYKTREMAFTRSIFLGLESTVGKFIIPKGSKYYVNNNSGILVSDQLIFKKIVEK